jgi:hypothetical protein
LASLTNGIINLWVFAVDPIINGLIVRTLTVEDINKYPQYIYIYYLFLISPGLMGLTELLGYFISHRDLRKTVRGNMKDFFKELLKK